MSANKETKEPMFFSVENYQKIKQAFFERNKNKNKFLVNFLKGDKE